MKVTSMYIKMFIIINQSYALKNITKIIIKDNIISKTFSEIKCKCFRKRCGS